MALFFIIGNSATGKSTISSELENRGYLSYDTDKALSRWRNDKTGYIHPKSSIKTQDRTKQFISKHSWVVPREALEEIITEHKDEKIFICGSIHNIDEIVDLGRMTFALTLDEGSLRHRLLNRDNNDWGKQDHELLQTLESNEHDMQRYKKAGFTIIDASQPPQKVTDQILEKAQEM